MPLCTEVGLGTDDIVLDGDPVPPQRGTGLNFWPMPAVVTLVYCGQTVGWIKMSLGTEVGLVPSHIM